VRLALLTQYYPPETGAPQRRLSHLAGHFVRAGHSVTVLTAMPNYPRGKIFPGYRGLVHREQLDGVNVIRTAIYPTQKTGFLPRLANYFSFVLSSAAVGSFLMPRPDYLFVESPPLFLGLSGYWLSRLKSTRLIFNVADLWPESAVRLGVLREDSMAWRVSAWLERFCYRNSWLITGQSKSILQSVAERFPKVPLFHLSNGVDTAQFKPERKTPAQRAALCSNGNFLAVYAGLHGLAQGLDQVLDAAEVLRSESGFQIVLIGDGPQKLALQERARDRQLNNVSFLNSRSAEEMPELLASADALLVPLKGFIPGAVPSKLYEGMGSGRPVVLIAEGEAADVVRETNAGIVVDPGDIGGIANALRRLRADAQLGAKMGENGRKAALERFDRDRIAKGFIQRLEEGMVE
jgi:colanic acid biosynthesis glycosyl transferase WcaI